MSNRAGSHLVKYDKEVKQKTLETADLKCSADVKVDRPVDKVVAWLTNTVNQGKFDQTLLKREARSAGPRRAGTQLGELGDQGGRKTEVFSEIAVLETNCSDDTMRP